MGVSDRLSRLSQFFLPCLLFLLSVVSILFTLRNDEIPVIGSNERPSLNEKELDAARQFIAKALQASSDWRQWCEDPIATSQALQFDNYHVTAKNNAWLELRRYLPQAEQDAVLRCQNRRAHEETKLLSCVHLSDYREALHSKGLFLLELAVELRAAGRKKLLSCQEALLKGQAIEIDFYYSYYWTKEAAEKPLHFNRLTGGLRVFPPLAQAAGGAAAL